MDENNFFEILFASLGKMPLGKKPLTMTTTMGVTLT